MLLEGTDGMLEVLVAGEGPAVVMIPSLGRGAEDFADLAGRLAAGGYTALRPQPRGLGRSTASLGDVSMDDLADDVATIVRTLELAPATIVGHAFGNRVARMTATLHGDVVESVVLLACGGRVAPASEHVQALREVFDPELSDEEHLAAVRTAFFAPGNDASIWFDGWNGVVAAVQSKANARTSVERWWEAGSAEVLVVQPLEDVIAPPGNATQIVEAIGDRASMATVAGAGHALLPEQPDEVARILLDWLTSRWA